MQEKYASRQKYFRAKCFDPLLRPEFRDDFRREAANPLRARLSRIDSEFESEHATTARAGER